MGRAVSGFPCGTRPLKGASPSRGFCVANSLDLSRPDMPGEKLGLFEISLRPLCVSSSCRRSLLQHHSVQQQGLQGKPPRPVGRAECCRTPTSTSTCASPRSSARRNDPAALLGVTPPNPAPAAGVSGQPGDVVQVLGNGDAGENFLLLGDHQNSTSEPPQGAFLEVCAALLISESHTPRPVKAGTAWKTQGDYSNVNAAKSAVDGFNKTHPD